MLRYVIPAQRKNLILAKHVTLVPDIMIAADIGNIVKVVFVLPIVLDAAHTAKATTFRIPVVVIMVLVTVIIVADIVRFLVTK